MTQSEYLTNLQTARQSILTAYLAALAAAGPNFSLDGLSVSRDTYLTSLLDQLKKLDEMLAYAAGPFAITQRIR